MADGYLRRAEDIADGLRTLKRENERLKEKNEMLTGELATIRDMLPDEYGFEEGTVEYAIGYPEGVKDLVRQTIECMQARIEFEQLMYEMSDKNVCDLMELLMKCLPVLDERNPAFNDLSKELREEIASFSV
ncbi:hypothetical protein [Bacillus velezensis]|uniref:hypothetical protein n=1 Tax=Bacillus velezensis TaxID=492670 RepID=UPI0004A7AC8B|nr:hypothetical protein [Bacillus velezensis]AUS14803.1 hypothetical protein C0W57_00665 [Bacillus velezensis]MBL4957321.1 hypothetical protein [Bacillus velezensis]MBM7029820.1 hypothetical protein [Bacillus velezensis]URD65192.1 hypothetical protein M8X21_04555 [Bacillus velezensis]